MSPVSLAPPPPLVAAIELRGASVDYGPQRALEAVDLTLNPGESLALVGPNGSGKTTLLRLIAGLVEPSHGVVSVPSNAVFGYVSQHASQPQWLPLSARDVIQMGRYGDRGLIGRLKADDRQIIAGVAEHLELDGVLGRSYGDLSGGQRQRVRIAQALAMRPNILVMDEPITGLDLPTQQIILDLIESQTEIGTLVLLTTHHLDEARHCKRVLLMAGRVVADGAPSEVLTTRNLRSTFGERVLGDHQQHDHDHDMLVIDDHGHRHGPS